MKAKVTLTLYRWLGADEEVPLCLTDEEGGVSTASVLHGTLEMSSPEVYELVRAKKADGSTPLFQVVIVE
jgi:hypothetical protein